MDHNWPYVAAGYSLTTAVLVTYVLWLWNRLRRAERSVSRDD
jgi:uncharacterized protein (DUF58 family)